MFKSRNFLISLLAVLLALSLFPFSAMAITEDEIQSAPEISLPEDDISVTGPEASEVTSQDDSIYCPGLNALPRRGTLKESEELNLPRLTDAELSMVREILAAREAGEKPEFTDRHYAQAENVFEAGVYPLDPKEFGGNTFYVILPYFQMNRNQLQSLVSAFDELGIPFDPDSLNNTNCVRGTKLLYNSATRTLSDEEQKRFNEIQEMIRHDVFDREAFTAADNCRTIQVQMPGYDHAAYDYLKPFSFYPYRAMTDNELATFALAQGKTWEVHPDRLEKKARQYAHQVFLLPLSMTAIDETRYAYSDSYIEYRNTFRIDAENSDGLYASPDEMPNEVMVEQVLLEEQGVLSSETAVVRILIDYPALYSENKEGRSVCSEEELKAAARQWAERYLLVSGEDILSDWVFDERIEDWGSVQYRLLTTKWLVCLEMSESDAGYMQACIYNRNYAVEFDGWNTDDSEKKEAETEESAWKTDRYTIDKNARQEVYSFLKLPLNMVTDSISLSDAGYVQYRCDYSFIAEDGAGGKDSSAMTPESMIVYQTPYLTKDSELKLEAVFLSYPSRSDLSARRSDEEYLAAARKWTEETMPVSKDQILSNWTCNQEASVGCVIYVLQTTEWTVYLQMHHSGEYCWAGFYPRINPD